MFPLVSSLEELKAARECVRECILDLEDEGTDCNSEPELGIMIESPAAVVLADALAGESDFFSIGTNDLVQYLLAVDRTNEHVADLYIDHHPAVLWAIKKVLDAGRGASIPVSVCGEMAANEAVLPVLVGMGLRYLSIEPRSVGRVQAAIGQIDIATAEAKASAILGSDEITAAEALL
jgi:phosphoenolpyruvate-protein kinase (PTS system EI component)